MKFALVSGVRESATPGRTGICPTCDMSMIAKCGDVKLWHWAHKSNRKCDAWWENETEWHRAWKGRFPDAWQEVVHHSPSGEKHIADVKTAQGWTIEFQHSYIKPEERQARNAFYEKLVWVVDGTRRKNDATQFVLAFRLGQPIGRNPMIRKANPSKCTLLREWACPHPVFLDFGDGHRLWMVLHNDGDNYVQVAPFSQSEFISIHLNEGSQMAKEWEEFFHDPFGRGRQTQQSLAESPAEKTSPLRTGSQQPVRSLNRRARRL